jgi:hypothetical protein
MTLGRKLPGQSDEAARLRVGPEISPTRRHNDIRPMARDEHVPVTVRRLSRGVIFWRSTDADLPPAKEMAERRQGTPLGRRRGRAGRRRRAPARAGRPA